MRMLWPTPLDEVTDDDLERLYGYPAELDRPWVQVNFTSSADGAVTVEDKSEGLSSPGDKRIFFMSRTLADVVLVGAGTVRAEGYRGVRTTEDRDARRARLGLAPVPPIAVVTGNANLDPASALFTDTHVPPIVLTAERAPEDRRRALVDAGADVVLTGDSEVDLGVALKELRARGLRRVDCEGGPTLFGTLAVAGLVDQLCLTIAPMLAGPGAGRIVAGGPAAEPRDLDLASVLYDGGFTLLRYRKSP